MNRNWKEAPFVAVCLVGINVIVYLMCLSRGSRLYEYGTLTVDGVCNQREYGRILWAMFLHASSSHLMNNMIVVLFLGAMLEKEIGHLRFFLFYLFSGIGGNLLSLYWKITTNATAGSLGASGAAFGLDGVLLAMLIFSRAGARGTMFKRLLVMVALSLYSGFASGNVDNAAHVGGLVVGFICGVLMCALRRRKEKRIGYEY